MVQRLGYFPFRGSPGKGGVAALKGIISAFRNGPGGGFVADGSQGPAQVAQRGLVLLAMYSGCPIFPVSIAADRCWRFRSWDKTLAPKAFCQSGLFPGAPGYRSSGGLHRLKSKSTGSNLSEPSTKSPGKPRRPQERLHKVVNLLIYYSERDCPPGELRVCPE